MTLTNEQKELVERAIPIVWSIVKKKIVIFPWADHDDMFQEGMLAVCRCATRFNCERASWCTFIYHRVDGAITDFATESHWGARSRNRRFTLVSMHASTVFEDARDIPSATTTEDVEPWLDMELVALDMPQRDWAIFQELKQDATIANVAFAIKRTQSRASQERKRFRADYRWAVECVV